MNKKYLIGGPSNSGKSTFVLSLVEYLRSKGRTAEAIELDVWSNSYTAFRGEVPFATRPKRQGLDWDWKTPLDERIRSFNENQADIVFGDLPGKLDEAIAYMCSESAADGALIISRTIDDLTKWRNFFMMRSVHVAHEFLTFLETPPPPIMLVGMNRELVPEHEKVQWFGEHLLSDN